MESYLTPTSEFYTSTYYGPGTQNSDVSTESIGRQSSGRVRELSQGRIYELPQHLVDDARRISANSAATWHTALACQDKNHSRGTLGAATVNRNRRLSRLSRSTDFGMYPPSSANDAYVSPSWRPTGFKSLFAKLVNVAAGGLAITGGTWFLRSLEPRTGVVGIMLIIFGICLVALETYLPKLVYDHMHFLCTFHGRGGLYALYVLYSSSRCLLLQARSFGDFQQSGILDSRRDSANHWLSLLFLGLALRKGSIEHAA